MFCVGVVGAPVCVCVCVCVCTGVYIYTHSHTRKSTQTLALSLSLSLSLSFSLPFSLSLTHTLSHQKSCPQRTSEGAAGSRGTDRSTQHARGLCTPCCRRAHIAASCSVLRRCSNSTPPDALDTGCEHPMYGVPTNRAYSWRTSECVASAEVDSCISSTGGITASL